MKFTQLLAVFLLFFGAFAHGANATAVVVKTVEELPVGEPIVVNGVLRSKNDLLLPASVDGELSWVLEEGTSVKAGAVVAKVDDDLLRLQRDEQVLLAERAETSLAYLQQEVLRLTRLQVSNLASQTQLAEMASRRDLAANDLSVARSRIAQLDETISRTEVVSPVPGIVAERLTQGGEFARRGEGVVRVVDPNALELQVTIPIGFLNRVQANATIYVVINDVTFETVLRSMVRAGDRSSQTFNALAEVPKAISKLVVAGQFAEVRVPVSDHRRALFVPRDAVVLRSDGNYVYRIDENNVAKKVVVTLGAGQGDLVAVSGDLSAGDHVAVRGVERLVDGQTVTLTNT